ncbi:MAG: CRISPR-associated protein Cas4 [Spirulina sp. SIO3F2]|nr:CRISPR-associated protein Cas4 [Spirulina sp. SIO3F2]
MERSLKSLLNSNKHNLEPCTLNFELTPVPLAALNQYSYCPHRCWRMFCAGEFMENEYTIAGTDLHQRVHTVGAQQAGETWEVRAIWLKSERYGLTGKADLVEVSAGQYVPVEYKHGQRGDWENDALQLCAQALCLEEMMGQTIPTGYVYYAQTHQRQAIALDEPLRQATLETIATVRQLLTKGTMPQPIYSKRCKGCSLYGRCLPQAAKKVARYQEL